MSQTKATKRNCSNNRKNLEFNSYYSIRYSLRFDIEDKIAEEQYFGISLMEPVIWILHLLCCRQCLRR